ncbi:MAG TPA: hypothetical protein VGJ20_25435 [Xanthobacteraceae bacterium]
MAKTKLVEPEDHGPLYNVEEMLASVERMHGMEAAVSAAYDLFTVAAAYLIEQYGAAYLLDEFLQSIAIRQALRAEMIKNGVVGGRLLDQY